jgi:diguanylate cyclase (GGDEF)-like protein/PAS domain S-box-containing protein
MGASDSLGIQLPVEGPAALEAWASLVHRMPQAAWLVDGRTLRVLLANDQAHRMLAWPTGALVGTVADTLIETPEDLLFWADAPHAPDAGLESQALVVARDGRLLRVDRCIQPFVHGSGNHPYYLVTLIDQTSRLAAEEHLEQALDELKATLESTADGILVTDLNGRIRAFNRRFAVVWGMSASLLESRDDAAVHAWLRNQVTDPEAYDTRMRDVVNATRLTVEDRLVLSDQRVVERLASPLWHRGQPKGRVYAFRDLSERLAADQRIAELSRFDALTGLPNRAAFAQAIERAVKPAGHGEGSGEFAVLLLDLDRFSAFNESLGAAQSDLVLVEVARRLRAVMRQGDVAARMGGDQFAMLVHEADRQAAEVTARRVLQAVAAPSEVDGLEFTLTCSIGLAASPAHGRQADALLSAAEEALRRAKAAGRACWRMHVPRRTVDARAAIRMDHAMRIALAQNRFRVHYQPQVDLLSGDIVGAEALLRWHDPDFGGEVSPARFIPEAEASGLIIALGDWVLRRAVEQAACWWTAGRKLPVAVNVSALQFEQPGFAQQVAQTLAEFQLPACGLELEVTESVLVEDADEAMARMQELHRLGVRLSIDDFGTGYSNLGYLKRLPIRQLKIDRSFVRGLPADASDVGLVTAMLQMARALGLEAVAEGVETAEQREFLARAGCSRYQGFLMAPALDVAGFDRLCRRQAGASF